jgi:hypothetical protein
MKLSEENERILAEIDTYNPGLANALRKACSTADAEGPSEKETAEKDAYFKAGDAAQRSKQYGMKRVTAPASVPHDEALRIIGLREYEYTSIVDEYGEDDVNEEVQLTIRKVNGGVSIIHAASVIRCELKKRRVATIGA